MAGTARLHDCILRPLQRREGCSTHKTRQVYGKSPGSYHSLHDTIPSGKDTCKPAQSSDLSTVPCLGSCVCTVLKSGSASPTTQLPRHETEYLQPNSECSAHAQKLTKPWPDRVQGSTKNLRQQPTPLPRLARHHPFGEGHVSARSVLRLEQGTEQEQLPRHATEGLQQNPEQSQHQ